jgi:hypothetical protein
MAARAPATPKIADAATPKIDDAKSIPLEEQIRQRAHQLYLQRAGQEGSELYDWLQAEVELLQTPPKDV